MGPVRFLSIEQVLVIHQRLIEIGFREKRCQVHFCQGIVHKNVPDTFFLQKNLAIAPMVNSVLLGEALLWNLTPSEALR